MLTPAESVRALDSMIESIPSIYIEDGRFKESFGFLVSKEIANGIWAYVSNLANFKKRRFKSGDEFFWRGIKCKVC